MTKNRFDNLTPGDWIVLDVGGDTERATFLGVEGEGDDRKVRLLQANTLGTTFEWSAYRMDGRWRYGSHGGTVRLVEVV